MGETIRLQKYCSDCGVLSRRAAEAEISAGRILVNGMPAVLGQKIDPDQDVVEYRGRRILPFADAKRHYILLNKPRGYLCTAKDDRGRKTVLDLVSIPGVRLYPVGRLDMDSDGLILLTDDGAFTNRLTHPRHEIPKIYHVSFKEPVTQAQLSALSAPMELDGYELLPIGIKQIAPDTLELTLCEGRNRQIRRMCEIASMNVTRLRRVAIGNVKLGNLKPGTWRDLSEKEVAYLCPPEGNEKGI